MKQIVYKFFSAVFGLSVSCIPFGVESEAKRSDALFDRDPYRIQLLNSAVYQHPQNSFNNAILWFPLWQRQHQVLYVQVNQRNGFNGSYNIGMNAGLRWLSKTQSWLLGVHSGYNTQNSDTNHRYQQVSIGAEVRNQDWHGYSNLYLPLNDTRRETTFDSWDVKSANDSSGLYHVFSKQGEEKALMGGELNLGYTLWKKMNARVYMGGYYYAASGVKTIAGPRVQFQMDLYNAFDRYGHSTRLNRISFDAMVQHDSVYNTKGYVGLTFAFTLGKQQSLSGLQQYMQVATPQTNDIIIRPNDAVSPRIFNNSNGSPLTIGYADNAASLDNARTHHANIIAVRGALANLNTITLDDNQVLTGGNYQLSNGVTLALGNNGQMTAATGQDLIQVSKNNRIENIALNADSSQRVIVNDLTTSYGALTIHNVTANAGVNLKITDGSQDANLQFTHNIFNMGDVNNQAALLVTINAGIGQFNISNNTLAFGNGDDNKAIEMTSEINGSNRTFTIDAIDNNLLRFGDGSRNAGIHLNIVDKNGSVGNLNVASLQNNQINFSTGNNNYALNANVSSLSSNGIMRLNNVMDNQISYTSGTNNNAFFISAGSTIGTGAVIINTVSGNRVTLPNTGDNQGFNFATALDAAARITVNVNASGQGLSAANYNASVVTAGNVTLDPVV